MSTASIIENAVERANEFIEKHGNLAIVVAVAEVIQLEEIEEGRCRCNPEVDGECVNCLVAIAADEGEEHKERVTALVDLVRSHHPRLAQDVIKKLKGKEK